MESFLFVQCLPGLLDLLCRSHAVKAVFFLSLELYLPVWKLLARWFAGRAAYGPLLFDCSGWAMDDRVAVVKKAKKELIFKRPEKSQTETATVYPIFIDVLENRYIRLPGDIVTDLYENCP